MAYASPSLSSEQELKANDHSNTVINGRGQAQTVRRILDTSFEVTIPGVPESTEVHKSE